MGKVNEVILHALSNLQVLYKILVYCSLCGDDSAGGCKPSENVWNNPAVVQPIRNIKHSGLSPAVLRKMK